MADCSLHTIPRHDYLTNEEKCSLSSVAAFNKHFKFPDETHHVLLIARPFLEDLQRLTSMQHTRCGKHNLKVHTKFFLI